MNAESGTMTSGPIRQHLIRLTIPMIAGIFAMSAFNLTDAYFVSRIGSDSIALAAVSFTFPVVMVVGAIAMGLGMSASILVSQAIGRGEHDKAKQLATGSLLLAVVIVAIVAVAGLIFMDPLFSMLGAKNDTMPLIRSYMTIWFSCVWALMIPMVGNNCIRATGDTFTPGVIMIVLAVLNIIFDPIFIFGLGPIPAMGVFGASLATVLSRAIGVFISLYLLVRRYDLVDWKIPKIRETLRQWNAAIHVALPSAATHLLMPVSMGFITRLVSDYGNNAIAATGASGRVINTLYIIPIALGSVLVPFSGQNWGARRPDRVITAWAISNRFSLYYSLGCVLVSLPLMNPIAAQFGSGGDFFWPFQLFILFTLSTSALQHVGVHSGFVLNSIGYPIWAFIYNAARVVALMCPLAWLGKIFFGLEGILAGVAASQAIAGFIIWLILPTIIRSHIQEEPMCDEYTLNNAPT